MRTFWPMLLTGSSALLAACAFTPSPAGAQGAETLAIAAELGTGMASWYGRELAGKRTASGELFDPAGYTAAHRELPFGSRVLVTYLATGESVVVRINDRGPWGRGRLIDISEAAAHRIGLKRAGHGQVRLQLLDDDPVEPEEHSAE